MMTSKHFARSALTRSFVWAPMGVLAQITTSARYTLRDTANFVTRGLPWSYDMMVARDLNLLTGEGGGGAPNRVANRVVWGGDLVIHLHDNADGGGGSRLEVILVIEGENYLGQKLRERIWIPCETSVGGFLADAYYRTEFAYATITKIELESASNRAANDLIEIGYDHTNRTGANWQTTALEADVKIAIPWEIGSIHDLSCMKADLQFTGDQTGSAGALDLPENLRGMRPVDLVRAEQTGGTVGAVFDPRDNSLRVGGCVMLTRSFSYEVASTANEGLAATASAQDKFFLFTVDPKEPGSLNPPPDLVTHTNIDLGVA